MYSTLTNDHLNKQTEREVLLEVPFFFWKSPYRPPKNEKIIRMRNSNTNNLLNATDSNDIIIVSTDKIFKKQSNSERPKMN